RCRYSAAGLSPESLAFQVLVEARDVFAVTVEKKCRPTLTRPDDLFSCLAPAWMRYFRVDVRPEPIFGSLQRLPEALRARVRKSKTHDRLDGLESVLPRHGQAQRRAMLTRKRMPVGARREKGEFVGRLCH